MRSVTPSLEYRRGLYIRVLLKVVLGGAASRGAGLSDLDYVIHRHPHSHAESLDLVSSTKTCLKSFQLSKVVAR